MFVAVYNRFSKGIGDYTILVLDTRDGKLEFIDLRQAKRAGVPVKNLYYETTLEYDNIQEFLIEKGNNSDYIHADAHGNIYIGSRRVNVKQNEDGSVVVNGIGNIKKSRLTLVYMFLFKGYIILRFSYNYETTIFYTFAVGVDDSVEQWNNDVSFATNKALAVQVEMFSKL